MGLHAQDIGLRQFEFRARLRDECDYSGRNLAAAGYRQCRPEPELAGCRHRRIAALPLQPGRKQRVAIGLLIDPSCAVKGTPTYELNSVWGFSIDVSDSAPVPNRAVFRFDARVMGASPQPLTLTPRYESVELIPTATRGEYYQDQAAVAGGVPPWTCAPAPGSSLPSGVSLFNLSMVDSLQDYEGCYLVGSVFATGDYSFTLRVTDSVGNIRRFPSDLARDPTRC